jgi:3-dehydroquinate dehydratase-2
MRILVINGPNINMLGIRERNVYGDKDYDSLCEYIMKESQKLDVDVDVVQTNIEGEIINYIQESYDKFDGIVINPGAYTHYSIGIYDALRSVNIPAVEVHITNIYAREEFRRNSVTAGACIGQISGFGFYGYIMSIMALKNYI